MWRSLKFIHMWINFKFLHMTDVEKSEISFNMCTIYGILLHFKLFCCKICVFLRFTLFCRKIGLLRFTRFCVEKILAKNSVRGEKMTNIRYVSDLVWFFDKKRKKGCASFVDPVNTKVMIWPESQDGIKLHWSQRPQPANLARFIATNHPILITASILQISNPVEIEKSWL